MAKKTKVNVKRIAKNAKPNNYLSNDELDRLEDEVTNANHSNANIDYLDIDGSQPDMSDSGSHRRDGTSMSARKQ